MGKKIVEGLVTLKIKMEIPSNLHPQNAFAALHWKPEEQSEITVLEEPKMEMFVVEKTYKK